MTLPRLAPTGARSPDTGRRSAAALALLGLAAMGAIAAADVLGFDRGLSEEAPPIFDWSYVVRSVVLALASVSLAVGTHHWFRAILSSDGRSESDESSSGLELIATVGGGATAMAASVLLLFSPETLNDLAREDRVVEWGSALLNFVASALVLVAAGRCWRNGADRPGFPIAAVFLVMMGGVFLLLGLEEVSWFQRVLEVESPEAFVNRNGQQELNFHNLATTATGNAYYIGGFVFGIAAPLLLHRRTLPEPLRWAQPFVPGPAVLYATAVSSAIVFEMWNVIWIQAIFWLTIPALILMGDSDRRRRQSRAIVAVSVFTAIVFLTRGDNMVRSWDDTEIRELVIPFGLVLYGLQVLWRSSAGGSGSLALKQGG